MANIYENIGKGIALFERKSLHLRADVVHELFGTMKKLPAADATLLMEFYTKMSSESKDDISAAYQIRAKRRFFNVPPPDDNQVKIAENIFHVSDAKEIGSLISSALKKAAAFHRKGRESVRGYAQNRASYKTDYGEYLSVQEAAILPYGLALLFRSEMCVNEISLYSGRFYEELKNAARDLQKKDRDFAEVCRLAAMFPTLFRNIGFNIGEIPSSDNIYAFMFAWGTDGRPFAGANTRLEKRPQFVSLGAIVDFFVHRIQQVVPVGQAGRFPRLMNAVLSTNDNNAVTLWANIDSKDRLFYRQAMHVLGFAIAGFDPISKMN
jgi:hypothetical protein